MCVLCVLGEDSVYVYCVCKGRIVCVCIVCVRGG